ncbi:MAG: tripartite tricarboxylate transporter substrate binding protein [Variibacter sp.]|nr:tripartite tricarboxylate transporter substrate binding protein [Variibacter sp.]
MIAISRRVAGAALLAAGALVAAGGAAFADYPERPVRVIVPFAAGGPTDVTARVVANALSERLGKQFYIENLPGAGGNTGTATAARAPADGYTLLVASSGFMVNPSLYAHVPYDPKKDFAPLTLLAASPNVLVVHPSVPAKTVKELVEEIRANPGKYSFAQPGIGSTPHLSGELFKLHFKLDSYTPIPFTGAAPAITSTIAGHTPTAWTALPPAITAVKEGQLRALAVTSEQRVEALPDVPTMAEQGVQDQEAETLTSMFVPAGTPKEIVDKLHREIAAVLKTEAVAEKLKALGFVPVGSTPEQWGKRVDAEIAKWSRVIKEAKIPQIK